MTLEEVTKNNKPFLKQFYHRFISENTLSKYVIDTFLNKIENEATVSINVTEKSLVEILNSGRYLNIFQTGVSEKEIEQKYKNYFKKLIAFTNKFQEAKDIKYGALNLGNIGTNHPSFGSGKWCIYLKSSKIKEFDKQHLIHCLEKYSLAYFSNINELSDDFYSQISNFEDVGLLALKKHHKILSNDESSWVELILDSLNYDNSDAPLIEIIMQCEIKTQYFESICIKKRHFNYYEQLISSKLQLLSERDQLFIRQYEYIQSFCEKNSINFKVI